MNDKSLNKSRYMDLCKKEPGIPIFSQHWWLDTVGEDGNWNVALVEEKGEIIASMPYYCKKKFAFNLITMPRLTQKMGIWIKYPHNQQYASKLSYEKKLVDQIIEQLPSYDMFIQNFHYTYDNWLPFYWKGFQQTTKYTYVIEDLSNCETIYRNFRANVKRNINKAQKTLKVYTENDIQKFYEINKKTFERQNMSSPYSIELISKIDLSCERMECRKIFFAEDELRRVHAAIYIVWDKQCAYYLMGGADPALRNSGAMSLLMWEAIKFVSAFVSRFDFEGSMIERIERFFKSFGSVQKPYFQIRKTNSKLLKIRKAIMD